MQTQNISVYRETCFELHFRRHLQHACVQDRTAGTAVDAVEDGCSDPPLYDAATAEMSPPNAVVFERSKASMPLSATARVSEKHVP
jgi:hypothetical protein